VALLLSLLLCASSSAAAHARFPLPLALAVGLVSAAGRVYPHAHLAPDEHAAPPTESSSASASPPDDSRPPPLLRPPTLRERADRYCANPPFGVFEEAVAPAPGLRLAHVSVLVRHGDRSAIHPLPAGPGRAQTHAPTFLCEEPGGDESRSLLGAFELFRSTRACVADGDCSHEVRLDAAMDARTTASSSSSSSAANNRSGSPSAAALDDLPPLIAERDTALVHWGTPRAPGEVCAPGELSTVGWRQARRLGLALGRAYGDLLRGQGAAGGSNTSVPLFVSSTDYGRTALTAGSLALSLLQEASEGPKGGNPAEGPLPPTHPIRPDRLPGLAPLPLRMHVVPRREDPTLWPKTTSVCARAGAMQRRDLEPMFRYAKLVDGVAGRVAEAAGVQVDAVPLTEELADDLFARQCHGIPLPCWAESNRTTAGSAGAGGVGQVCLSSDDASTVLRQGDALYISRFTNRAVRLLTYPLLRDMLKIMRRAANGAAGAPRVAVRAAHDTVISPLLATLGAMDGMYGWPNYASRVAFEVWEGGGGEWSGAHLVRLLYNGVDFTRFLACARNVSPGGAARPRPPQQRPGQGKGKGKGQMPSSSSSSSSSYACLLTDLEAQVEALLGPPSSSPPLRTWEEACAAPLDEKEEDARAEERARDAEQEKIAREQGL
jgi:hypothetical protein